MWNGAESNCIQNKIYWMHFAPIKPDHGVEVGLSRIILHDFQLTQRYGKLMFMKVQDTTDLAASLLVAVRGDERVRFGRDSSFRKLS